MSINATGGINYYTISWNPSKEVDVVAYTLHEGSTSDFIPDLSNRVMLGPATSFYKKTTAGNKYLKVAAIDTFEDLDNINYSGLNYANADSYPVVVTDLEILPEQLNSTQRVDFALENIRFYFAQYSGGVRTVGTEATLYWEVLTGGKLYRADKTYTTSNGNIANANGKYIIAVLDDGSNTFTIKTPMPSLSSGLPTLLSNEIIIGTTSTTRLTNDNFVAYIRQTNSAIYEGVQIREATIGDAHITGVLSASKIATLSGSVVIDGLGITLNDLNNATDIKVGGRNLLVKTNTSNSTYAITSQANGKSGWGFTITGNNIEGSINGLALKQNTDYTISFIGWVDSGTAVIHNDLFPDTLPESTFTLTTTPSKFTWVVNSSSADMLACRVRWFGTGTSTRHITDIKLEEGNIATDWTPSPEDAAAWEGLTGIPALIATSGASGAPSGTGFALRSDALGYYSSGVWKTYMDSSGNFGLAGSGTHGLTWNGSTLSIQGDIAASTYRSATSGQRIDINYTTSGELSFFAEGGAGIEKLATIGVGSVGDYFIVKLGSTNYNNVPLSILQQKTAEPFAVNLDVGTGIHITSKGVSLFAVADSDYGVKGHTGVGTSDAVNTLSGIYGFGWGGYGVHGTSYKNCGGVFEGNTTHSPLKLVGLSAAPSSPGEGEVYFDSTSHQFKGWNGTSWSVLG